MTPIEKLTAKEMLDLARNELARLKGRAAGQLLGTVRTDDPNRPPPDPAVLHDLVNLWRIVENKAARAAHMGAATVPLTASELAGVQRALRGR